MSLRINTNVPGMTALRNLSNTNVEVAGSINRLSTGLRIVTAADDPAGLIISEGMRATINGIEQASRNSQDAVNMAKTAEGALDEVQRLLRGLRGITVYAANTAVVDNAQLQANQSEIRSVIQSIDRIATSTQWSNKRLLDGTAGTMANITNTTGIAGAYFGSTFNGVSVANGPITVTQTTTATQTRLDTSVAFASTAAVPAAGTIVVNGYTFSTNGTTDTVQNLIDRINAQASNTGVTVSTYASGANVALRLTSTTHGADFPINFFDPSGVLHSTPSPAPTVAGTDAVATVQVTTASGVQSVQFTGGQGAKTSGLRLTDSSGNAIVLTPAGNGSAALTGGSSIGSLTAGNLRFQIGPNQDQSVSFGMPNIRSTNLGTGVITGQSLATVDVTTQQGALNAMQVIDSAITQLSQMRGELGSFQKNFLESTVRTLNVARENLTAAESTIRDADVAEEMSKYTRFQILQQSGISILAQANSQPQQVLKLLQQ